MDSVFETIVAPRRARASSDIINFGRTGPPFSCLLRLNPWADAKDVIADTARKANEAIAAKVDVDRIPGKLFDDFIILRFMVRSYIGAGYRC